MRFFALSFKSGKHIFSSTNYNRISIIVVWCVIKTHEHKKKNALATLNNMLFLLTSIVLRFCEKALSVIISRDKTQHISKLNNK